MTETTATVQTITIINNSDGSVEAHRPGCRDIARKVRSPFVNSWTQPATSKRAVFLDYNSDFIAEAGDDWSDADGYQIDFKPCVHLPETD